MLTASLTACTTALLTAGVQRLCKNPKVPPEYAEHVFRMDEAHKARIATLQEEMHRLQTDVQDLERDNIATERQLLEFEHQCGGAEKAVADATSKVRVAVSCSTGHCDCSSAIRSSTEPHWPLTLALQLPSNSTEWALHRQSCRVFVPISNYLLHSLSSVCAAEVSRREEAPRVRRARGAAADLLQLTREDRGGDNHPRSHTRGQQRDHV